MEADPEINKIANETRGRISRRLENRLPQDMSVLEAYNKLLGEEINYIDLDKVLISLAKDGLDSLNNQVDDNLMYSYLYAMFSRVLLQKRNKSVDFGCTYRFNTFESSVRTLSADRLIELFNFVREEKFDPRYTSTLDSIRDINMDAELYLDKYENFGLNKTNIKEDEIRQLKKILNSCIQYWDSNDFLTGLSFAVNQNQIQRNTDMKFSNKMKQFNGTSLEFIGKTYNSTVRNAIAHGDEEIRPDGKIRFTSNSDTEVYSYSKFVQYTCYCFGNTFCIHSIPVILYHEFLAERAESKFVNSSLKELKTHNK